MIKAGRQVRVMMLGWEYPPRFAGGLGKACQGLSQAMARLGSQVFFVLPTFPERVSETHLEVIGAQEVLLEAGWEITETKETRVEETEEVVGKVTQIRSDAVLFPYGAPTDDYTTTTYLKKTRTEPATHVRKKILRVETQPISRYVTESKEIYGKDLWTEIQKFSFTVKHLAETHEVDLVHAHDWMTFPAAFEFQRITGVPVYLHVHATEYDRSGESINHEVFRIERDGFRKANHIFAVSRYTAGIIEKLYGIHRKKISVVYNAPDEHAQSVLPSGDLSRVPQVVFLGRLTFQKGPDHFLKAAALVAQVDPTARFILCGTGDMFDKLRHQTHRLGIEDRVHFTGFVDPAGVDEILQRSKVLVMPSVSEPFGLVALEAIRSGVPVILSKQSGVREVLQRALQVDFWDHEKLADQMIAALRLPSLSQQLVQEGLNQVQQLSWDKSGREVIETYRRQLGSTYAQMIGGAHGH